MALDETRKREAGDTPGAKQPWEPMTLVCVGRVAEIVQGGGGKLAISGADTGDTRKPRGSG